ncbi:MAG TPA: DUF4349 domain-containing protein [Methanomicrobiales archaeon]|nr:DUF4349 domain-containing protein [Methanomicrobiales archaeon]
MTNLKDIAAILLVAAAIVAAGCMGQGLPPRSSMETVSGGTGVNYGGAVPAPATAPAQKIAGDQAEGGTNADQTVETKIIKTGQVTIEVSQVPVALNQVRDIAVANGGYLSSSNIYTSQNDRKTGYAMIRIPADKFDPVMQALAPLGKVLSSSEQRSDVTEQYVDLTIQNQSYHAQLDNYYRLMAKATAVEDIIKIQAQIDRITLNLNQVEGRLRYLNSQIDLSTITVSLQEPEPVGGETGYNIVTAINEGIAAFFGMISAIIVFIFAIIPLVIIAIVVYAIYRYYRKRKGGSAVAPMAPAQTKA